MKRFESKRFKFDVDNYLGDRDATPMKHITIFSQGAMQVDLWLDPKDVVALRYALNYND